jgi:hypothetical protein
MDTADWEYTSFLVRLWREPPKAEEGSADGGKWLAQVEHIPDGEKAYLASLDELFTFIRGQLPGPSPTTDGAMTKTTLEGGRK